MLQNGEGDWVADAEILKGVVRDHFQHLFTETDTGEVVTWGHFPQLTADQLQALLEPFIAGDVHKALKAMAPLKSPGPDCFHAYFFQKYWALVDSSVCETVVGVLRGRPMPEGLNDTFISLIPKVNNPQMVTQFRPIGLCNIVYKLITKCIVQQLKHSLPTLISPLQSSFVPGRQIGDNIIIM